MVAKKAKIKSSSEIILRNSVVGSMCVFYIVFLIVPIIIALIGSFHQWNPLNGVFKYTGIENYSNVIKDPLFWKSTWNTLIFSAIVIAFRVALGLAIAYAIYSKLIKYKNFFRTVFYMPVVTPIVAVAYVWKIMYNPQIGIINNLFGLNTNWLFDAKTALPAIMIMTIWKDFGYAVVMFMAGLYSLPEDCFEAARVDGASSWQEFKNITLPLLKPMTLFVVVTSIISYIQTYVPVLVMTEGGPGTSTFLSSYIIYDEAFVKYNFGYASAISFILFVITAILTAISFKVSSNKSEIN